MEVKRKLKKDKKVKYALIALVVVVVVGFFMASNGMFDSVDLNPLKVTMQLQPEQSSEGRQAQVIYGAGTTINYITRLNVTIQVQNTGGTALSNVRITAANPNAIKTLCFGMPTTLPAGSAAKSINCTLTEATLFDTAQIPAGSNPWTVTVAARDDYRGIDLAPVTSSPINVEIKPDLTGTFTATVGFGGTRT